MKPSRALAFYGITLDELVEAIRAGNVKTYRWGTQELIRPHRWHSPPKPIEVLDQEVDLDRESLEETFGEPVNHKSGGRKSSGSSQGPAIIATFLRMVKAGDISIKNRGRQEVARKVKAKFPDYTVKYIAELIAPEYRRLEGTRTKH
jgi:hypothetical protein